MKRFIYLLSIVVLLSACNKGEEQLSKETLSVLVEQKEDGKNSAEDLSTKEEDEIKENEETIKDPSDEFEITSEEQSSTKDEHGEVEEEKSNAVEDETDSNKDEVNKEITQSEAPSQESDGQSNSTNEEIIEESANDVKDEVEEVKEEPKEVKVVKEAKGEVTTITWDTFFDNNLQNEPSEHFRSLNGKKVELVGFMGEALDFKGGWFILIEKDDGECPFCSVDESFWNKVMVVFVENKNYLRNIPGPVKVTGTLDVGVREDETGYKTMFRIYHTQFKSAK